MASFGGVTMSSVIPRITCGVATLGIGFPAAFGDAPALNLASFGGVAKIGVTTLGVCFTTAFVWRDREKSRKTSVWIPGLRPEI
jgi:hypothetical protein